VPLVPGPVSAGEAVAVFQFDLPGKYLGHWLLFGFDHVDAKTAVLINGFRRQVVAVLAHQQQRRLSRDRGHRANGYAKATTGTPVTQRPAQTTVGTSWGFTMIRTGEQYRDSIRDGREVYINGERVLDVPSHPAFKPLVDIRARIYDAA
jgi:hypothetical protein